MCGEKFFGYFTRRFCTECRRLRNLDCIRRHQAGIPIEERRRKKRFYYHAHREKILEKSRRWRESNRDRIREYAREYYQRRKAALK